MASIRLAGAALALILGGLGSAGMAQASTVGAGLLERGFGSTARAASRWLRPVDMHTHGRQISSSEVAKSAVATWTGNWTNDIAGGAGEVTIRIERAEGGTLSGTGETRGGTCATSFSVSGWYRGSLVQMELAFPAAGDQCPAATVSVSMRLGERDGRIVGVGHWSNTIDGRSAGKEFGILELTRQ